MKVPINQKYMLTMPNITPHVCRHTYCSIQARAGMYPKTLQYLMGHSDISVTMNTYTHLGLEDAVEEMGRVQELENARKEQEKLAGKKDEIKVNKRIQEILILHDHGPGIRQEIHSVGSQGGSFPAPVEENHAKLSLQFLDCGGQGRLSNIQTFCGPVEGTGLSNGDHIVQLLKSHFSPRDILQEIN